MHRISIRDVLEIGTSGDPYVSGYMAHIEPPVGLAPAAVEQYIRHGRLDMSNPEPYAGLVNPILIGNSDDHTAIYASPEYGYSRAEAVTVFASRVKGLLGHLGIESEVIQNP